MEEEDQEPATVMSACLLDEWLESESAKECSNDDVSSVRALRHIINSPHKDSFVYLGGRIFQYSIQAEADQRLGLRISLCEPGKKPLTFRIHAQTMFGYECRFLAAAKFTILAQVTTKANILTGKEQVTTFLFNLKKGEATSIKGIPAMEEAYGCNNREYFLYREYATPSIINELGLENVAIKRHMLSTMMDWPSSISLDPRPDQQHLITYVTSGVPVWKHGAEGYITVYDMVEHRYNIVSPEQVSSEAFRYSSSGNYMVAHKKFPTSFLLMSSDDFTVLQSLDYPKYCPFVDLPFYFTPKVGELLSVDLLTRIAAAKVIVRSEGLTGLELREESCFLILPIVPPKGQKLAVVHLSISDPMNSSEVEVHDFKPDEEKALDEDMMQALLPAKDESEGSVEILRESFTDEVKNDVSCTEPMKDDVFAEEPAATPFKLVAQMSVSESDGHTADEVNHHPEHPESKGSVSEDTVAIQILREADEPSEGIPQGVLTDDISMLQPPPPASSGRRLSNTMIIEMLQDKVGQVDPSEGVSMATIVDAASIPPHPGPGMSNTEIIGMLQEKVGTGTNDVTENHEPKDPIPEEDPPMLVTKEAIEVNTALATEIKEREENGYLQDDEDAQEKEEEGIKTEEECPNGCENESSDCVDGCEGESKPGAISLNEFRYAKLGDEVATSEESLQPPESDHEIIQEWTNEEIVTEYHYAVKASGDDSQPTFSPVVEPEHVASKKHSEEPEEEIFEEWTVEETVVEREETELEEQDPKKSDEEIFEEWTVEETVVEKGNVEGKSGVEQNTPILETNDPKGSEEEVFEEWTVEETVVKTIRAGEGEQTEQESGAEQTANDPQNESEEEEIFEEWTVEESGVVEQGEQTVQESSAHNMESEEQKESEGSFEEWTVEETVVEHHVGKGDEEPNDEEIFEEWTEEVVEHHGKGKEDSQPDPRLETDMNNSTPTKESEEEIFEEWTEETAVEHGCQATDQVQEDEEEIFEEWTTEETVEHHNRQDENVQFDRGPDHEGGETDEQAKESEEEIFEEWTEETVVEHQNETKEGVQPDEQIQEDEEEIFEEWTTEETVEHHNRPDENVQIDSGPNHEEGESDEEIFEEWTVEEEVITTNQNGAGSSGGHISAGEQHEEAEEKIFEQWTIDGKVVELLKGDTDEAEDVIEEWTVEETHHNISPRDVKQLTPKAPSDEKRVVEPPVEAATEHPSTSLQRYDGQQRVEEWISKTVHETMVEQPNGIYVDRMTVKKQSIVTLEFGDSEESVHRDVEAAAKEENDGQSDEDQEIFEEWTEEATVPHPKGEDAVDDDRGDSSGSEMMVLEEWSEEAVVSVDTDENQNIVK